MKPFIQAVPKRFGDVFGGLLGGQGAAAPVYENTVAPSLAANASPVIAGTTFTYTPGTWSGGTGVAVLVNDDDPDDIIATLTFGVEDTYVAVSGDAGKTVHVEEIVTGVTAVSGSYDIVPRAASTVLVDSQGTGATALSPLPTITYTNSPDTTSHRIEIYEDAGLTSPIALLNNTVSGGTYTVQNDVGFLPISYLHDYYVVIVPVAGGIDGVATSAISFSVTLDGFTDNQFFFDTKASTLFAETNGTGGVADGGTAGYWGGLDAVPNNATQSTVGQRPLLDAADAIFSGADSLDMATTRYYKITQVTIAYNGDFTFYAQFSAPDWTAARTLIGYNAAGQPYIRVAAGGASISFRPNTSTAGYTATFTGSALPTDTAIRFKLQRKIDAGGTTATVTLWINGSAYGTPQSVTIADTGSQVPFSQICRAPSTNYWDGKLQSIGLFNTAHDSGAKALAIDDFQSSIVGGGYDFSSGAYVDAAGDSLPDGSATHPYTLPQFIAYAQSQIPDGQTVNLVGSTAHEMGAYATLTLDGAVANLITVDGSGATGDGASIDLGTSDRYFRGSYVSWRNLRLFSSDTTRVVATFPPDPRGKPNFYTAYSQAVNVYFDQVQAAFWDLWHGTVKGCFFDIPIVDASDAAHNHNVYTHGDAGGDAGKLRIFEKNVMVSGEGHPNIMQGYSATHQPVIGYRIRNNIMQSSRIIMGNSDDTDDIEITDNLVYGSIQPGYGNSYTQQSGVVTGNYALGLTIGRSWLDLVVQNNIFISKTGAGTLGSFGDTTWDIVSATPTNLDYNVYITSNGNILDLTGSGFKSLAWLQSQGAETHGAQYASIAAAITAGAIPAIAKIVYHEVAEDEHYYNIGIWNYTGATTIDLDLDALGLTGACQVRFGRDYDSDRVTFTVGTPSSSNGVAMDSGGILTVDMRLDTAGGYRTTKTPLGWDAGSAYHADAVPSNPLPYFTAIEVWAG